MTTDEIVRALRICVHVPDNSGGARNCRRAARGKRKIGGEM